MSKQSISLDACVFLFVYACDQNGNNLCHMFIPDKNHDMKTTTTKICVCVISDIKSKYALTE